MENALARVSMDHSMEWRKCSYLYVSDEGHSDSFLKLIQWGIEVEDFHNL